MCSRTKLTGHCDFAGSGPKTRPLSPSGSSRSNTSTTTCGSSDRSVAANNLSVTANGCMKVTPFRPPSNCLWQHDQKPQTQNIAFGASLFLVSEMTLFCYSNKVLKKCAHSSMVRAHGLYPCGCRFESCWAHKYTKKKS